MKRFLRQKTFGEVCEAIADLDIQSNTIHFWCFCEKASDWVRNEMKAEYGVDIFRAWSRVDIAKFIRLVISEHSGLGNEDALITAVTALRTEAGRLVKVKGAGLET